MTLPYPKTDRFLPTTREEMDRLGWDQADVILFTGDAYVDHPSFGTAMIGRVLEHQGYKVAIVPQPNWRDDLRDFKKLGRPRLYFGVTAGNMDSMVNHYTATRRLRSDDAYTPGGVSGFRPDYPTIVYTKALKKCFPDVPVVLGGIEASLRRLTHYDYWYDSLRPGILISSGADYLIYGMGEQPVVELTRRLDTKEGIVEKHTLTQVAWLSTELPLSGNNMIQLPSHEECVKDIKTFGKAFCLIETESNRMYPKWLAEKTGASWIVVNPPFPPVEESILDSFYDLAFTRLPHPRYLKRGKIPAYEMIRHSVNIHRGCFGGCSFCTISAHQGKFVSSRSEVSVLKEVDDITQMPDFKGYISDLGGPSANMYRMKGIRQDLCIKCKRPSCIFPSICHNLSTDHTDLLRLYELASARKGVKKIFIGSGVRYDLFFGREDQRKKGSHEAYFERLVRFHVSGRLKVAPEHTSDKVLKIMRKPSFSLYHELKRSFEKLNQKFGLRQQLIPYFISSHPGCTLQDMQDLAREARSLGLHLEQVQDLTPTPMTLSSVMFYTGMDPYTGKTIYVARSRAEKDQQKNCFFWDKGISSPGRKTRIIPGSVKKKR